MVPRGASGELILRLILRDPSDATLDLLATVLPLFAALGNSWPNSAITHLRILILGIPEARVGPDSAHHLEHGIVYHVVN